MFIILNIQKGRSEALILSSKIGFKGIKLIVLKI